MPDHRPSQYADVRTLDLSNQYFVDLPPDLCRFRSVLSIDLSGNLLTDLPSWLAESFPELQAIDLSNNKITSLDPVLKLDSLKVQYACPRASFSRRSQKLTPSVSS